MSPIQESRQEYGSTTGLENHLGGWNRLCQIQTSSGVVPQFHKFQTNGGFLRRSQRHVSEHWKEFGKAGTYCTADSLAECSMGSGCGTTTAANA